MRWGRWAGCMGIICSRSDDVLDLSSFCFLPFTPKLMIRKEGVQVASFLKSLTLEGEKKEKEGILGSIVAVLTCNNTDLRRGYGKSPLGFRGMVLDFLYRYLRSKSPVSVLPSAHVPIAKPKKESPPLYHPLNPSPKTRASTNFPLSEKTRQGFGSAMSFAIDDAHLNGKREALRARCGVVGLLFDHQSSAGRVPELWVCEICTAQSDQG